MKPKRPPSIEDLINGFRYMQKYNSIKDQIRIDLTDITLNAFLISSKTTTVQELTKKIKKEFPEAPKFFFRIISKIYVN